MKSHFHNNFEHTNDLPLRVITIALPSSADFPNTSSRHDIACSVHVELYRILFLALLQNDIIWFSCRVFCPTSPAWDASTPLFILPRKSRASGFPTLNCGPLCGDRCGTRSPGYCSVQERVSQHRLPYEEACSSSTPYYFQERWAYHPVTCLMGLQETQCQSLDLTRVVLGLGQLWLGQHLQRGESWTKEECKRKASCKFCLWNMPSKWTILTIVPCLQCSWCPLSYQLALGSPTPAGGACTRGVPPRSCEGGRESLVSVHWVAQGQDGTKGHPTAGRAYGTTCMCTMSQG